MQVINIPGDNGIRIKPKYSHFGKDNPVIVCLIHDQLQEIEAEIVSPLISNHFNCLVLNIKGSDNTQDLINATSCWDWIRSVNPETSKCWMLGAGHGSWIGMQLLMRRPEFERFIAINPPFTKNDFSFLAPCPCPGLIVEGTLINNIPHPITENVEKAITKTACKEAPKITHAKLTNKDYKANVEQISSVIDAFIKSNT